MHTFELDLTWAGTTATRDFGREGRAQPPGKPALTVTTAPAFGGSPTDWNPEDLFGAALALCHMQTYLSLAAKVGVDVLSYEDRVETTLDTVDGITRVTRIALRPTITVGEGSNLTKAEKFFHKAHKYCFIARSITTEVVLEPTFVVVPAMA